MNKQTTRSNRGVLLRFIKATFMAGILPALVLMFGLQSTHAGSATWKLNPQSSAWTQAGDWTPATVPNGDADVATFGVSNVTVVDRIEDIHVAGIVFNPGASAYSIGGFEEDFGVGDLGVVNNSGLTQNFVLSEPTTGSLATLYFYGEANAGTNTIYTIWGAYSGVGGFVYFYDSSSAGNATLIANPETNGNTGGKINFEDNSTAGDSTLITNAADNFYNRGQIYFFDDSRAENATLIINGGILHFTGRSLGDTCRVVLNGTGYLTLVGHDYRRGLLTVGSIEGDGWIDGAIIVGSNNLSTTFSGLTSSITKIGRGTLTLTGTGVNASEVNVKRGKLIIVGSPETDSGYQAATVSGGGLAGTGKIVQSLVVGGAGAPFVSPGLKRDDPGSIMMIYGLTFNPGGTYRCSVDTVQVQADQISATTVAISPDAHFVLTARGTNPLPVGTVFTVVRNDGSQPIAGAFGDLGEGAIISAGGNNLQASYTGGDGNDLTLIVVP